MDNSIEKLVGLIADVGGEIYSRKKLHKMVYLLQELGEDFDQDFMFHHYGVFSPSLARDLDFASKLGLLRQSREENQYRISVESDNVDDQGLSANIGNQKVIEAARRLNNQEPQFLETLSTIVYLHRGYFRGEDLKNKLRSLKSSLDKYYDEAFVFARELYDIEA